MDKDYYSIVEVAGMLGLHVKTVRNYVRQGRLRSTRLGKQYRIARADLEAFAGTGSSAAAPRAPVSVEASIVVQVEGVGRDKAMRIANVLPAAAKGRQEDSSLRIDALYYEESDRLKVMIMGSAESAGILLGMVDHLARE